VKKIVIWHRFYPAKHGIAEHWEHNHITEDLSMGAYPIGMYTQQSKNWAKGTWKPYKGLLTNQSKVVYSPY